MGDVAAARRDAVRVGVQAHRLRLRRVGLGRPLHDPRLAAEDGGLAQQPADERHLHRVRRRLHEHRVLLDQVPAVRAELERLGRADLRGVGIADHHGVQGIEHLVDLFGVQGLAVQLPAHARCEAGGFGEMGPRPLFSDDEPYGVSGG